MIQSISIRGSHIIVRVKIYDPKCKLRAYLSLSLSVCVYVCVCVCVTVVPSFPSLSISS
jgi:glycopeptide antibiotics resistance protein